MPLTYKDAGVSIDAGNALVDRIRPLARSTERAGAQGMIGGFGAFFDVFGAGYRRPLIVSSTDGAGTKVMLAQAMNKHDTIGIDAVAMCVNDVVVCGAEPLFFLDYFVTGRLDLDVAESVIAGVAEGCRRAGCALIGGETAEHPGHLEPGSYDLAGFAVGAVESDQVIDGRGIEPGDAVIGLLSSGVHSNGYSLVRRVLERCGLSLDRHMDDFGRSLGEELLEPTVIYVQPVLNLRQQVSVKGLAHITGGGLVENIPRMLPRGMGVTLNPARWRVPGIFRFLADVGDIPADEMYRTFNMGLGMVCVVAAPETDRAVEILTRSGVDATIVGSVTSRPGVVVEGM